MKITFGANTLADPQSAAAVRGLMAEVEEWPGGDCLIQTEKRYGQSTVVNFPRGNVDDTFVFHVFGSQGSYGAVFTAYANARALTDTQATLIITAPDASTLTMANATLKSAKPIVLQGKGLSLRYTFKITTITTP